MRTGPSRGRRLALAALAVAPLAVAPLAALAQAPRALKRLGILSAGLNESVPRALAAPVLSELAKHGYVEGKTLELLFRVPGLVEYGWKQLPRLGIELAREKPDAVLTLTTQATRAMAEATKTIPVVAVADDPVGSGFASSLARPGANVTGLSLATPEVARKLLEFIRFALPAVDQVATIHWDEPSWEEVAGYFVRAANDSGIRPVPVPVGIPRGGFLRVIEGLRARGISAAVFSSGAQVDEFADVARAAIKHRVALVTTLPQGARLGFIASMNPHVEDEAARLAQTIVQVFKGRNPATTPIDFPKKFHFALNRVTAKAIGLELAPDLLLRADEVFG